MYSTQHITTMKNTLLLLATAILLFGACKKDGISKKDEFNDSYAKFQNFKKASANSYKYVVNKGSFTGVGFETTITVVGGVISTRSFVQYQLLNSGVKTIVEQWEEKQSNHDIGSHTDALEALTLDQVYDKAKNDWLKADTKTNDVYFETDANGLIADCGYVPKGCQDDCFVGISITSITQLD